MRRFALVTLLLLAAACSSGRRPANVKQPEIRGHAVGSIFFGSSQTAAVDVEVSVTNRADVPLIVHAIRISSPMMDQYTLQSAERSFHQTLAPGESQTFALSATAYTNRTNLEPTEPLQLRVDVDCEAAGARFREIETFR